MMQIDILIPTAYKGGVENVISMTGHYLVQNNAKVRVIQMVGTDEWCDSSVPVHIVSEEARVFTIDEISHIYLEYIQTHGTPDIAICAVWPLMCVAVKKTFDIFYQNKENIKRCKIVSWIHHGAVDYVEAAGWGGYQELKKADYHLAINSYLCREIKEHIPNAKVYRICNPVDLSKYETTKKKTEYRKKHKLQAIYVGRISSEKRLDVILQAVAKVKDFCELHIVGSTPGEYENEIRKLKSQLDLQENVKWYSWMDAPWQIADEMDVCVMASDVEGFPLVAIEALANGLPLFTTPAEGMEELIVDGVNGYIYPFEDYETLAKLLWAMSANKLPRMNAEDCIKSIQKYDKNKSLAEFEEVMKLIMKEE